MRKCEEFVYEEEPDMDYECEESIEELEKKLRAIFTPERIKKLKESLQRLKMEMEIEELEKQWERFREIDEKYMKMDCCDDLFGCEVEDYRYDDIYDEIWTLEEFYGFNYDSEFDDYE